MNNNYGVSVIIPVYNSTEYLEECINSLLNQTVLPLEIIIVDDGSSPKNAQCIDKLVSNKEIIQVYHIRNCGQLGARSFGVKKAASEWVLFVDSDDILNYNTIETLISKVKLNTDTDCVIFSYKKFVDTFSNKKEKTIDDKIIKSKKELYKLVFFDESFNAMWRKFARKSLFTTDWKNYYDIRFAEDLIQSIDIYKNAKIVQIIEDALYGYRININSVTNSTQKKKYSIDNRPYELVYDLLKKEKCFNKSEWNEYSKHALKLFEEQIERLLLSKCTYYEIKMELNNIRKSRYNLNFISKTNNDLKGRAKIIICFFRCHCNFVLFVAGRLRKIFPCKKLI